ncbi:putative cyclin-dependent kinase F-2 [Triticum aestivum]|nr:putative cyclin-dependent kinase F-2 [Triticum aestivum]
MGIRDMEDDETASGGITTVASQIASICATIGGQGAPGTAALSARRVAAVSAMIDEVAQGRRRKMTRKRRMGNSRCYEEVCTLGGGTFGDVFKARHRATGQTVAVKALRCERSDSKHVVSELLREACIMAACGGHPSLVALRGVVRTPRDAKGRRDYFLVMEFAGPSLRKVLNKRIRLGRRLFSERDVRSIVRQLLAGAEAMHTHGIMHCDIKPENILVVQHGGSIVVKIGDYGAAMSTAERDPDKYWAAGTWAYSAPEMLLEDPRYDTRVDLWSIGCVMAELLTGNKLFPGDGIDELLYKIFDLLGTPGEREWWPAFGSPGHEVQEPLWRAHQRLRKLFPKKLLSKEGFQVLQGLLTCDPSRRLDAAAALRLPWFTDTGGMPVAAVPETGALKPLSSVK